MPDENKVNNEMLEAALDYAEHGISVIPILPGAKEPPIKWKEFQTRIASLDEIHGWFKRWPKANVAIVCGKLSDIDCLDADGPFARDNLEGQSGVTLPETVSETTGRKDGGTHYIFKHHGDGTLKNWKGFAQNGNGSKCDLRTEGGYFVASPSIHKSGKRYQWDTSLLIEDPEPFPPGIKKFIYNWRYGQKGTDGGRERVDPDKWFKEGIPEGHKHEDLYRYACACIHRRMAYDETLACTIELARRCNPLPKDGPEKAAKDRVDQAFKKFGEQNNPVTPDGFDNLDEIPADIAQDEVQELNKKHAVIMIGGKCAVINQTIDPVFNRPDISFSSKGDFLNMYANRKIKNPDAPTKKIPIGKLWWESEDRKQYEGLIFEPQKDFDGYYNLWRGFSVVPKEGDWTLMERLIREAISSGNEGRYQYILAWMARIVQDPGGQRPGVAFVMRGRQGVGKGKFATEFGSLLSDHFLQVAQAGQVTGRFNTHLKDCVVLFVDEGFWAGDKQAEGVIKNLITEPTITVEPKGKDLFKVKNNVNVLVASNSDWVVPAGLEERRFFTVDVDDCFKGDYDFFRKLTAQMDNGGREAMLYDLQKMDISGVNLRDFERTDALLDQILESMTPVQKWWYAQLRRGAIRMVDYGVEFGPHRDEWPTSASNEQLYDSFELFVAKIKGYLPVPEVFGRQLNKLIVPVEIVRPRTPDGAPRRRLRIIPNLERCRKVFEKKLEMEVDWEDEKHEIPPF